jgi:large subunit ribosomal protein L5
VDLELNESPPETEPSDEHPPEEEQPPEAVTDISVSDVEAPEGGPPSEGPLEEEAREEPTPVEPEETPAIEPRRREAPRTHSMRDLKIGKVVVNITTGQSGEPLERAMTILENLTGQRPCTRRAKQTIRTFGIRRHEPISCMVTLRGERAEELLRKGLAAVRNRINPHSFDRVGNFAFGIREHIDIPGQRYDPSLGIIGMDVMATVERPGYRVARRRRARSKVGMGHRVTREESIEFIKSRFGVEVGLPSE